MGTLPKPGQNEKACRQMQGWGIYPLHRAMLRLLKFHKITFSFYDYSSLLKVRRCGFSVRV